MVSFTLTVFCISSVKFFNDTFLDKIDRVIETILFFQRWKKNPEINWKNDMWTFSVKKQKKDAKLRGKIQPTFVWNNWNPSDFHWMEYELSWYFFFLFCSHSFGFWMVKWPMNFFAEKNTVPGWGGSRWILNYIYLDIFVNEKSAIFNHDWRSRYLISVNLWYRILTLKQRYIFHSKDRIFRQVIVTKLMISMFSA